MINITNKKDCCGCAACIQRCPKQCISLKEDNEGFLYPIVNTNTCIDCGLCEKVCPIINEGTSHIPLKVYAAINKNENIRLQSSSGGVFSLLAEHIINEGGIVFGARFDENWQVRLDYTEGIGGIAAFRGSKYIQARTEDAYFKAETFLKAGRKVMFTGTPCQISGLKKFLRKEYDNLLAVDFVCHGVPSPKIWNRYLNELLTSENQKKNISHSSTPHSFSELKSHVTDITFRDKSIGWKKYRFVLQHNLTENITENKLNSISYSDIHRNNTFMRLFLSDIILRPSCYDCKCKEGKSNADLTIADFWGIENISPEMDDDKGTSLILIQTEKGRHVFSSLDLIKKEQTYEDASRSNQGLKSNCKPHPKRDLFWNEIDKVKSLNKFTQSLLKEGYIKRVKLKVKQLVKILLNRS